MRLSEVPTVTHECIIPLFRPSILNPQILKSSIFKSCERGWIRTIDPLLKRQMLYP